MTARQIALELPEVPQASLYRHINKLQAAGVLVVAEERQVHGTVERLYEVEPGAAYIDHEKLVSNRDKSIRYFEVYLSCLRHAFARYAAQPVFDFKKDGVTFFSEFACLSDEEQIAFNRKVRDLIVSVQKNAPAPNRRRRSLSLVALPESAPLPLSSNPPTETIERKT